VVPNPVVHFEITGADGTALQKFYRELFDWKIDTNNEWQYGMVETGGEGGINGGIAGNQDGAAEGRVTVHAAVDDLQAYLDKAERLGASVVMPVTEVSGMTRRFRVSSQLLLPTVDLSCQVATVDRERNTSHERGRV
jgi:predicted enzyme related to lactoylglutathione lyase